MIFNEDRSWFYYSQSKSRMTSISENEMNIQLFLCNVPHVNGILNISLAIFPKKDVLTKKKIQNTWETIVILEILNAVI